MMKVIVVLCSLALYASVQASPSVQPPEQGLFTAVRRVKSFLGPPARQFAVGESPASEHCLAQCMASVRNQTQRLNLQPDQESVEKACAIYDVVKPCVNGCPDGRLKQSLTKGSDIAQFICHDSSLKTKVRCLYDTYVSQQAGCNAGTKCGQHVSRIQAASGTPNDENRKAIFKESCLYTKCMSDCFKPTVISNCGNQAQQDLQTLLRKVAAYTKSTLELEGNSQFYPTECDRVTA